MSMQSFTRESQINQPRRGSPTSKVCRCAIIKDLLHAMFGPRTQSCICEAAADTFLETLGILSKKLKSTCGSYLFPTAQIEDAWLTGVINAYAMKPRPELMKRAEERVNKIRYG